MGAVAVTLVGYVPSGELRGVLADVTFSSSYATGGDTVSPAKLGLAEIIEAQVHTGTLASDTGRTTAFVPNSHGIQAVLAGTRAAPKLKAFQGTTSEVANATNLSAVPALRILFRGH